MIKKGMYVRVPHEFEFPEEPRDFIYGIVSAINFNSEKCFVNFHDLYGIRGHYGIPETKDYFISEIDHVFIPDGVKVHYKRGLYTVITSYRNKDDDFFYYYIRSNLNDSIVHACESELTASFVDGEISPMSQMKKYEFQNPVWYAGRYTVSRTVNQIENSCYGFNILSGCKIFLKPYQLKTVIRCMQGKNFRTMIADEVGLGKTIEAAMIIKLYIEDNHNKRICFVLPDALVEQWKTELAFKFNIYEGANYNDNTVEIIPLSRIDVLMSPNKNYDFIVMDEVHRIIGNSKLYNIALYASKKTSNVVMLSATPVQKRKEEYYMLLKLIQPEKYEKISVAQFSKLVELQNSIMRETYDIFSDLSEYEDLIDESENEHTDDTEELYEELQDAFDSLAKKVNNPVFTKMIQGIKYESDNFGVPRMKTSLAYLCENYQLEKCIIRNRRSVLGEEVNERQLVDIHYDIETAANNAELNTYREFAEWFKESNVSYDEFNANFKRPVSALFSSSFAFYKELTSMSSKYSVPESIMRAVNKWMDDDNRKLDNLKTLLGDPSESAGRLVNIIDYIDQETDNKKVLIFTNFNETFDFYMKALLKTFSPEKCAFFRQGMSRDELELNVYRFQTESTCRFLLSDSTGGEGRNFQNSDIIIHIDMPWNANDIEQRIGRLDRIGRESEKPVVSVVPYAEGSLEESLFKFWNDGVGLFTKSQSGLEIIMNDIDEKIVGAVCEDFKYGLLSIVDDVNKYVADLKETVKYERYFDLASYQYQVINKQLERTIERYSKYETAYFSQAMMSWASLAGFNGDSINAKIVQFDEDAFSVNSANKAQLVLPNMSSVVENKLNKLRNHIRELNKERMIVSSGKYIRGTFERSLAVKNDYIHFFAPGDLIFDTITKNAINSYRGRAAAFACISGIQWTGLVFSWSVKPNIRMLVENNISINVINKFRYFLSGDIVNTVYSFSNPDEIEDKDVIKEFHGLMNIGTSRAKTHLKHLGSRGTNLRDSTARSKVQWFKNEYPKDKWEQMLKDAYKDSKEKMMAEFLKKSNLKGLKSELQNISSTNAATAMFYDNATASADDVYDEKTEKLIYEAFQKPEFKLESVCYVRMMQNG